MSLADAVLTARGLKKQDRQNFLHPDYDVFCHDPFLLPDMKLAVERLVKARETKEIVYIYGDYDIDT